MAQVLLFMQKHWNSKVECDNSGEKIPPQETSTYQILGQARVGPAEGKTRSSQLPRRPEWVAHPSEATRGYERSVSVSVSLYTLTAAQVRVSFPRLWQTPTSQQSKEGT